LTHQGDVLDYYPQAKKTACGLGFHCVDPPLFNLCASHSLPLENASRTTQTNFGDLS